ncbi:amino acid permease [Ligilactobacillus agilis]|uniref:APC family permease n=1 Tax=Ligilactobacillus agilis TaxID=1601 RepID=UPI00195E40E2|nr:amino acid permease [Ligilactobacillus agilis]MBM6772454.1 amino acid permease [Ligilactobacillus agilis]
MLTQAKEAKKIAWWTLALMAFSTVWGFGNVVNGYIYFGGTKVIFSWVLMFLLYFVPYALMVGELGAVFKESEGGVSSWVDATMGPKIAYYAGWTYWACHVAYISSKGTGGLRALAWAVFQSVDKFDAMNTMLVQGVTFILFVFFCWLASRGLSVLKLLATIAGSTMFIMSILYILLMLAAPVLNPHANLLSVDLSFKHLLPSFNVNYFTSLSILVFAVGGCEKISPYVNKMKHPSKDFPKGMIALAIMVMVCAILGTIAMGMMFNPKDIDASFDSYVSNGAYWAFQKLGNYYHLGNSLMVIYAWTNVIGQFSTLVLSIDAPLRMLLGSKEAKEFIPTKLLKQNKYGAYTNGIWMVGILSGAIILVQSVVPGATKVLTQLVKLNATTMPLRYLWVFAAYIALRMHKKHFQGSYQFVKNDKLAIFFGAWCFLVTALCCLLGIYSPDPFTLALNILTPVILTALGIILPIIKQHEKNS